MKQKNPTLVHLIREIILERIKLVFNFCDFGKNGIRGRTTLKCGPGAFLPTQKAVFHIQKQYWWQYCAYRMEGWRTRIRHTLRPHHNLEIPLRQVLMLSHCQHQALKRTTIAAGWSPPVSTTLCHPENACSCINYFDQALNSFVEDTHIQQLGPNRFLILAQTQGWQSPCSRIRKNLEQNQWSCMEGWVGTQQSLCSHGPHVCHRLRQRATKAPSNPENLYFPSGHQLTNAPTKRGTAIQGGRIQP